MTRQTSKAVSFEVPPTAYGAPPECLTIPRCNNARKLFYGNRSCCQGCGEQYMSIYTSSTFMNFSPEEVRFRDYTLESKLTASSTSTAAMETRSQEEATKAELPSRSVSSPSPQAAGNRTPTSREIHRLDSGPVSALATLPSTSTDAVEAPRLEQSRAPPVRVTPGHDFFLSQEQSERINLPAVGATPPTSQKSLFPGTSPASVERRPARGSTRSSPTSAADSEAILEDMRDKVEDIVENAARLADNQLSRANRAVLRNIQDALRIAQRSLRGFSIENASEKKEGI